MRIRSYILFFLFITTSLAYSQENISIEAIIVDFSDKTQVLPFANVIIENTSIGTISNENGVFELTVSAKYAKSNVVFSFMGYKNKVVPLRLFKDPKQKVYLEPVSESLSEIVIQGKNKYEEYVLEAIKNTRVNYADQAEYLDAYYRELTQIDGQYTKFTDASTVIYYSQYSNEFNPTLANASYMRFDKRDRVKQSTPFPEPKEYISAPGDQVKIIAVRKSDNLQKYRTDEVVKKVTNINLKDLQWVENSEIGGGPLRLTGADKLKRKQDFFNPKTYKDYRFKLEKKSSYDDRAVYVISFKPKDSTKCLAKYEGVLTMDQESKAIIAYNYNPARYCKKQSQQQFGTHLKTPDSIQQTKKIAFIRRTTTLKDFKTKVTYYYFDNKWHLKNIKSTNYYQNKGDFFDSYNAITNTELLVHNVRNENVFPFLASEAFESTFSNALFNSTEEYKPNFWKSYSNIIPTGVVGKALEDLESKTSLEEQFKHQQKNELPATDLKE